MTAWKPSLDRPASEAAVGWPAVTNFSEMETTFGAWMPCPLAPSGVKESAMSVNGTRVCVMCIGSPDGGNQPAPSTGASGRGEGLEG